MKRLLTALFVLVLVFAAVGAQAETYYVHTQNGKALSLRSTEDNSILLTIPYGAAVETDDLLSNDDIAYIHYGNKAGYVSWDSLSKEPVDGQPAATPAPAPQQPASQQPVPQNVGSELTIETVGASIQYDKNGAKYYTVSGAKLPQVIITAERKPAYWVINGIRYDFEFEVPRSFTLENVTENLVIEAVPDGQYSTTALSMDEIQARRTGEPLLARGINAKLCFIKPTGYGAGGWMDSFDFTDDFKNLATEQWEQGGQVTLRCRASVPDGRRVSYWKFDEMKIDFDTDVTQFIVHMLNVSKVYEPVFGAAAKKTATPAPVYYTVTCTQCTFSGGGYSNATSGKVPAGTVVTVSTSYNFSLNKWYVNGSRTSDGGRSITCTINQNTHFEWNTEIN